MVLMDGRVFEAHMCISCNRNKRGWLRFLGSGTGNVATIIIRHKACRLSSSSIITCRHHHPANQLASNQSNPSRVL